MNGERCEMGGAPGNYVELRGDKERGVCSYFELRKSLGDFTVKPSVSCPPPSWGYNTVLMLTISSQSLQSSIFCLLIGF